MLNIFESMKKNQNFGEIKHTVLRIYYDDDTIPALVYNLEEEESHRTATVLKVVSIYKSGGMWKVKAINEGVTSSLSSVFWPTMVWSLTINQFKKEENGNSLI